MTAKHKSPSISVYNSGNWRVLGRIFSGLRRMSITVELVTLESSVYQQMWIWKVIKKALMTCQSHDTHYSGFYLGINSSVIPQTICSSRTSSTYYSSVSLLLDVIVWLFSGFIYLHFLKWVQRDPASRI